MTDLDAGDPAALEAALEALPGGTWLEVTVDGEAMRVVRVPGGWYLPGDMAVASADVAEGRPDAVRVVSAPGDRDDPAVESARGGRQPAQAEEPPTVAPRPSR